MSTYNLYKNKAYSLRLPNEMQEKIKIIAQKENRKISQQYEIIVRNFINDYEAVHGEIKLESSAEQEKVKNIEVQNSTGVIIGNNSTINM